MTHAGPNVVGLDLSLAATGIATGEGERVVKTNPADSPEIRLEVILSSITRQCREADLVVVEDLPKNARFGGVDLGMVHGAVRLTFLRAGVLFEPNGLPRFAWCPPSNLKKFATGKGGAGKADVRLEVYKRFGLDIRDDNACDAFVLRAMGLHHLGYPLVGSMPKAHAAALEGVKWPPPNPNLEADLEDRARAEAGLTAWLESKS